MNNEKESIIETIKDILGLANEVVKGIVNLIKLIISIFKKKPKVEEKVKPKNKIRPNIDRELEN